MSLLAAGDASVDAWDSYESRASWLFRTGRVVLLTPRSAPSAAVWDRLGLELAMRCASLDLDALLLPASLGDVSAAIHSGFEVMRLLAASLDGLAIREIDTPVDRRALQAGRDLLLLEDGLMVDDDSAAAFVEAIRLVRAGTQRTPVRVAVVVTLATAIEQYNLEVSLG